MFLKKLAVYCGSNAPQNPSYTDHINQLADELIEQQIDLVYGGAKVGLMGTIATRCVEEGRRVIGVIPHSLSQKEIVNTQCTELHQVESMHERKKMMMEQADAFVIFPGGIGTMEEFFEVWTWSSIGLLNKPIGLLNVDGYFDSLLEFFVRSQKEGLLRPEVGRKLVVSDSAKELMAELGRQSSKTILHVVDEDDFSENRESYGQKALDRDGFIHCCLESQLEGVLERYYKGKSDVTVMTIDVAELVSPLVYENTSGGVERFPHLYGLIPSKAMLKLDTRN